MNEPISVVQRFMAGLGPNRAGMRETFRRFFSETTIWENVGVSKTVGIEEAFAFSDSFPILVDRIEVDMLSIAAQGNKVLTERVDHLFDDRGLNFLSARLMGIFEIDNGRIARWCDYFDTSIMNKIHE